MRTRASLIGLGLALLAMSAAAQTVTGSGTTNTVPVFTGTSTVGNSPITVSGGNVGIGTTSPNATLEIQPVEGNAQLRLDQPNWKGGFGFTVKDDGNLYIDRYGTQIMTMQMNGAVGIGTTAPAYKLDVAGPIHSSTGGIVFPDGTTQTTANANVVSGTNQITQVGGNVGIGTTTPNTSLSVYIPANSVGSLYPIVTGQVNGPTTVGGMYGTYDQSTPYGGGLAFQIYKPNVGLIEGMRVSSAGNVGIGTTNPGAKLEVSGSLKLTAGSGGSVTYADGSVQTTAWNGVLNGGDYAEDMRATGKKEKYCPGDVLVLAEGDNTDVQKSAEPYSAMVAGIYATKPGVVGRREAVAKSADNVPMAMVGVVPTKVSAENGPIRKGDLLVSASLPGYAMKGTDRSRMLGAVLGKAMGSLDSGTGVIEVLVTLQ